jgi:hypothetical protein
LEDVVAWHYNTRGLFSVKSAYKVQRSCERRKDRRGAQSSSNGTDLENEIWKKLWELKCPGKIKHFLWRFAHNSLALRIGLERRGMELDTKCVMCERQNEDGCHLFFKCKYAMPVWKELGLEHIRGALAALHSAKEVIKMNLGMKEGEQMKVMVLLRRWWLERNRVREGEKRRSASDMAMLVAKLSDEFQAIGRTELERPPKQK